MGNFFDQLRANVARAYGAGTAKTVHDMYEAAVKSGATQPGNPNAFSIGTEIHNPDYRLATLDEANAHGGFLMRGIEGKDMLDFHKQSMQDPNFYIERTTPEEVLRRIYGDNWEEVKRAALLSQQSPHPRNLADHPAMRWLTPTDTQDALSRQVYAVNGPGVGFVYKPTSVAVNGSASGNSAFTSPRTILFSRANDRLFGTRRHEFGHMVHRSMPYEHSVKPFMQAGGATDSYRNRFGEMFTELSGLKSGEYQRTGRVISNKQKAEEFMQSLLDEKISPRDPDPIANFGPQKGEPISGYSWKRALMRSLLKPDDVPAQERDKAVSLLPKLFSVAVPVAVGSAASQDQAKP